MNVQSMLDILPCLRRKGHLLVLGCASLVAIVSACGGDTRVSGLDPDPIATQGLVIAPGTLTLRSTLTQRVHVTRANGSPLTTPIQWSVGNPRVVHVLNDSTLGASAEGSTTLTATSDGISGSIQVTVPADMSLGDFRAPFAGDVPTSDVFDHDLPYEFNLAFSNGYLLSFWGEKLVMAVDSHVGYDWVVPSDTPILAAGTGRVVFAGAESPSACPVLNGAIVSGLFVAIAHGVRPGEVIATQYLHLSRIDVKANDEVVAGQQIGLSGSTGCSTGPHLHFGTFRVRGTEDRWRPMDPYGWTAPFPDPWTADTGGVASIPIWSNRAPRLFGEARYGVAFTGGAMAAINAVRYPFNDVAASYEFIALVSNPALSTIDITGWTISNLKGDTYTFPTGTMLNSSPGVVVHTGASQDLTSVKYWGRSSAVWTSSNCATLRDQSGAIVSRIAWGTASCTGAGASPAKTLSAPMDITHQPPVPYLFKP